jgi:hypothetical protein
MHQAIFLLLCRQNIFCFRNWLARSRLRQKKWLLFLRNWLGGTLSGLKRPIFRHTLDIFFTVALLRHKKHASSGKKWPLFYLRRDHANQLHFYKKTCPWRYPL